MTNDFALVSDLGGPDGGAEAVSESECLHLSDFLAWWRSWWARRINDAPANVNAVGRLLRNVIRLDWKATINVASNNTTIRCMRVISASSGLFGTGGDAI